MFTALSQFENWQNTATPEAKLQTLKRFGVKEIPDQDWDFDLQLAVGTVCGISPELKVYFRYPHMDKNIMVWAEGNEADIEAFNYMVQSDYNAGSRKPTPGVAYTIFHQVSGRDVSGWEYWVRRGESEIYNQVQKHIESICARFGIEMDLML